MDMKRFRSSGGRHNKEWIVGVFWGVGIDINMAVVAKECQEEVNFGSKTKHHSGIEAPKRFKVESLKAKLGWKHASR